MLQIIAWHGRTLADHQQQLDIYGAKGYRALSLSIYNPPSDPRYACVLIKRPQVIAEEMFSNMNAAQFEQTLTTMAAKHMGPHIVSATGPANGAVYAASFIAAATTPLTHTGLSVQEFTAMNQHATVYNLKLVWFDCYGSPGDERYIATWWPDPEMLAWNCDGVGEDAGTAQQRYDGLSKTWAHVAQFATTPSGRVTSLYYDGLIGAWQARFGLTSAEYQTLFDQQIALGLAPLRVCAKGDGDAARFGVIFAQREQTPPRVFNSYGPVTNAPVDAVMEAYLAAHNIRSASLAIVAGTRLVYAKGYTWAEPGFPSEPLRAQSAAAPGTGPVRRIRLGDVQRLRGALGGVTDMARLVASLSLITGNPVLEAETIDQWLTNAVTATSTLSGPDAHGYHGWDWVQLASAANKTFQGSKGGSLPGTGTVTAFTTGGLSYIAFSADQRRPGVTVDWLAPLTQLATPPQWATTDLFPDFGMQSFTGQANAMLMAGVSADEVRLRPSGQMTPNRARLQGAPISGNKGENG